MPSPVFFDLPGDHPINCRACTNTGSAVKPNLFCKSCQCTDPPNADTDAVQPHVLRIYQGDGQE
jgi:hypothetical protein